MGSGSWLGHCNHERSCGNESLLLRSCSPEVASEDRVGLCHHVARHLHVPQAALALCPCKGHPRDGDELREVLGGCSLPPAGALLSPPLCLSTAAQTTKMRRSGARGPLAASPVAVATRRGPGPAAMPAQQRSRGPATCHAALVSPWLGHCLTPMWADTLLLRAGCCSCFENCLCLM